MAFDRHSKVLPLPRSCSDGTLATQNLIPLVAPVSPHLVGRAANCDGLERVLGLLRPRSELILPKREREQYGCRFAVRLRGRTFNLCGFARIFDPIQVRGRPMPSFRRSILTLRFVLVPMCGFWVPFLSPTCLRCFFLAGCLFSRET